MTRGSRIALGLSLVGIEAHNPVPPEPGDAGATKVRVGASGPAGAAKAKTAYFCPMHPEVFSDKPGRCPKCNMFLERHRPTDPARNPPVADRLQQSVGLAWERSGSRVTQVFTGENGCGGTPLAQHAGLYLLHCHNLDREDAGMMLSLEAS